MSQQQQSGGAGRAAIVTGGGSGIGRAIALRLASDGFAVAVVDLDATAAEGVASEVREAGGDAIAVGDTDVSNRDSVNSAVANVRDGLGPVQVLVNNAGVSFFGPFLR